MDAYQCEHLAPDTRVAVFDFVRVLHPGGDGLVFSPPAQRRGGQGAGADIGAKWQEFSHAVSVRVTRVALVGHGIKKLRIERCVEEYATDFEPMVDCELTAAEEGLQRETYQGNKSTVGGNVRYVKIVIAAGHEAFTSINAIQFEGTPA